MRLIDVDKINWEYKCISKEELDDEPTVKAIPLELIEKEIKQLNDDIKWAWYYGNTALDKMEYLKTWLTIKLEDWEEEQARLFEKKITEECVSAERFADWEKEHGK